MTRASSDLPRLDLGLGDLAPDYDLLLCDVWGVVHNGVHHHAPAAEALCRFRHGGGSVVLITNAPAPKAKVVARLDSLDVPRNAYDDVATSGDVTTAAIVAAGCPALFNIGPKGEIAIYREAARLGQRPPPRTALDTAELVICVGPDETGDLPEDYDAILARMKARNLEMICANPDIVVEVGDQLVYCAGAIAERYAAIGGKVTQAGKPFPAIYERAFSMARAIRGDVDKTRTLAIGDAFETDLRGAHDQGIASLFVTAGIHRADIHKAGGGGLDAGALSASLKAKGLKPKAALPFLAWTA